jgi:hypothetical protein
VATTEGVKMTLGARWQIMKEDFSLLTWHTNFNATLNQMFSVDDFTQDKQHEGYLA